MTTNYKLQATNSESGVTLVISIVMLAAVTFVSFALSAIIIREIGVARVILRSEPAISGANSGGEVGLYCLFRGCPGGSAVSGNTSPGGAAYQVITHYKVEQYDFSASDQEISVALYDPENMNNIDPGYRSFVITNSGSRPLSYYAISWKASMVPCDPGNPGGEQCFSSPKLCNTPSLVGGQSVACNLTGPDYRYVIYLSRNGNGGDPAIGNIKAYAGSNGGGTNLGVPTDSPYLDITGSGSGVQRKIQIKL